jgi:transcriptional regulator with XRE-family HTH domain
MHSAEVLRAARSLRRVSQRELAVLSGVPRTTIDRIESSRSVPRIDTMCRLLASIGCELVARTTVGGRLPVGETNRFLRDRGGRHYPAHLPTEPMTSYMQGSDWWGWFRVAWQMTDDAVPPVTYRRRTDYRPPVVGDPGKPLGKRIWDDAT